MSKKENKATGPGPGQSEDNQDQWRSDAEDIAAMFGGGGGYNEAAPLLDRGGVNEWLSKRQAQIIMTCEALDRSFFGEKKEDYVLTPLCSSLKTKQLSIDQNARSQYIDAVTLKRLWKFIGNKKNTGQAMS